MWNRFSFTDSFKPIFGWAKTDLNFQNEDGSNTLMYDQAVVENMQQVKCILD